MANRQGHRGILLDEQNCYSLFVDLSVAPFFHASYVSRFRNSGNVEILGTILGQEDGDLIFDPGTF